jgi:hypothetical protein
MTAKDDLRYIRRVRERELKARDRSTLRELRGKIRTLNAGRRARIAEIKALCRAGRERARAAVRLLREQTRAELAARVARLRDAERGTCTDTTARARAELAAALRTAQDEARSFGGYVKRTYGRRARAAGMPSAAQLRRERMQESDDDVRRNVGPELAAVFERVKRQIKPGPRRTRTEAFLEWVQENPDEAHAIVYANAERDLARFIEEQNALERRVGSRYRDDSDLAAALAGVPF